MDNICGSGQQERAVGVVLVAGEVLVESESDVGVQLGHHLSDALQLEVNCANVPD
jgi:predicted ribosome-associated RNA-binding protein Tma20